MCDRLLCQPKLLKINFIVKLDAFLSDYALSRTRFIPKEC